MRKTAKRLLIPAMILCTLTPAMPVMAAENVVKNLDSATSSVSISVSALVDDDEEYESGDDAYYDVSVSNLLGESWIRVKFDFSKNKTSAGFSDKSLSFSSNDWVKRGDYWYYTQPVASNSTAEVVDSIKIPKLKVKGSDAYLEVTVKADAVQKDAVTPDFSSKTPWDNVKPDASDDGEITPIKPEDNGEKKDENKDETKADTGKQDNAGTDDKKQDNADASDSAKKDNTDTGKVSGNYSKSHGGSSKSVSSLNIYSIPIDNPNKSEGSWKNTEKGWTFSDAAGNTAKKGWIYTYNGSSKDADKYGWYYFDENGIMCTGWVKMSDTAWYHLHTVSDGNLGKMDTGWHYEDEDARWYYLNKANGVMVFGWNKIDGKRYYFATSEDAGQQNWFYKTFGNTLIGKWVYGMTNHRSFGSMYQNEETPDGIVVDEKGAVR